MPDSFRKIPIKPILSWSTVGLRGRPHEASVLEAGSSIHLTSGRVAIAVALQKLGVGPGHEVLVPAYHCAAMIEPVLALGAAPIFYRITPSTEVDLDDIARRLSPATKAVLVTHYFGFPQPMPLLRSFATDRGIGLLEDCAHMFFGRIAGQPPGSYGDYAIASAMKFFPVYDGGYLISKEHPVDDVQVRSAGLLFDLKALSNSAEHAARYRGLWPFNYPLLFGLAAKDRIWGWLKRARPSFAEQPLGPASSDGGYSLDSHWLDVGISRPSKFMVKIADRRRIVRRRRENYDGILRALRNTPGLTTLFPELPADVVPHVFPILLHEPETAIPALQAAGVPMLHFAEYLWPGVDEGVCPVSRDYSRRLVQLPCHQDLDPDDIEWMARRIVGVINGLETK